MENKSVILIYFLFLILISGFVSSLPFIENRGIIMDNNLPYIQKEIYCAIGGSCILNELTVSNLSVIGSYFNISVLNYNVTGTIYADDYAFQNGNTINDTFVNIIGDTMTGNLTIDTGGVSTDVELRLQTDVNENSYLYYMESDTGILGFMAWYDGSGGGAYKIDAIDGTGTIIPKMEIDRDDYDVDFFVNENLNDNNITGIQCLELNGEYICSWDSVNASSSSSSNCSTCNISDLINVDTTDVGNAYILVYHAASGNWRATSSGSLFGWNIDSSGGFLYNDSDTAYYNYTKLDDEYVTYADFNKEIWGTNNITTRKDMIVWGRYCNRTNCYTVTDFLASSSNVSSYNDTLLKQSIIDNSTSDRLYTDNINTTSNIEELGFNTTNNLKSYFDSLYQVIGSYVTHIFLDTNYYNKTQSDAIETSIRTSIIDNSTSNNLYTDGRVDSINNNSGMINYTDVNYTTGYFEDVIIYRDLTIGEDLICTDCILPGALHLMYFGLSDFADDVGYQLIAEAFTVVNFTELINGYTNITYDSELNYINNCSVDDSCEDISYDTETQSWINSNSTYTNTRVNSIINITDNSSLVRYTILQTVNATSLHLNQDNWNGDDWITYSNPNFIFNESMLEVKYYNVDTASFITGTLDAGLLNSTYHNDGKYDEITINFSESSGSPALDLRINFTNITDFTTGVIRYKTNTLVGEFPIIQLWDYDDSVWENYPVLVESESFATITQPVYDSSEHIQDGVVQMRIYKTDNGNTQNHYYVDWIAISKGFGTPAGEEVDPIWESDKSKYYNSSQVNDRVDSINNETPINNCSVEGSCSLITYDSELTYINNCSIDNSCDLITYDSELTYTSLDGLDIVNQSMLDNDTIIRNHNTSWITNNQDPDTTINNCSVDNSCNLITYDSELNYYTTTDFLIDYSTTGFYTDDNITANEIYALTPHTNRSDADINGLIDTKVDDTFVNDLFVDDLTTDADTTYSAGDGNITITSEKLYLAFVDLAELDNTISLFITKAVSDLTNYFTKTEVTASFDALPNLTSADVVTAVGNWSDDKSSYWDTATDLDTVISADEISEANIAFSTACAAGDYYRLNGNDLECTTPTDTDTFNSSSDIISVVNVTDSYWDIIAKDLFCTDCLTGTEIAELTDADVSNTLTASDLVAGSSVVSDAEVDNDITVETNHNITITGSGATLHFDVVNSTHGKIWMS